MDTYHSRIASDYEAEAHSLLNGVKEYTEASVEEAAEMGAVYTAVLTSVAQAYATLALSHRTADLKDI